MAEQVLKFSIRTDGAQARAEAEATARAIVAAVRGAVSSASAAVGRATAAGGVASGASSAPPGGDARAAEALQRQRSASLIRIEREHEAAVANLQRQRSAALLAAERAQTAALASLQRQRSAAILTEERARSSASASLQRQRSAAIIGEERRRTAAEAAEERARQTAVASLQRQRSAALIAQFKAQEAATERARKSILTLDQALSKVGGSLRNLGLGLTSLGASLSLSLTAPLLAAGAASFRAAKDIDASVNTLKAFTGSAEVAEARLAKLIETSRKTPGLTTALAAQLDAQLRVALVTEQTIDRILPAVGRLNAVKPIDDPDRFVQNLVQLVTQNFERQDLKELVGRSPLAGQLITQIFGVDSPTNAAAIRKAARQMGIRTVDDFFAAFADAAARNKGLQNVTESIGTRFAKLADRLALALRPLGLALADSLGSIADVLLPVVEGLGKAFGALPRPVQTAVIAVGAFAAVLGPTLFVMGQFATGIGGLISAFGRLHVLGLIPTVEGFRLLRGVMAGTTSLAAGQAATTAAAVGGWAAFTGAILAAVAAAGALGYGIASLNRRLAESHPRLAGFIRAVLTGVAPLSQLGFYLNDTAQGADKLGQAQGGTVAPTARATAEVNKQAESLRLLKMALREAELAAKSRAAAARRDFEEQKTTSEELTRALIGNVNERLKVELDEIDEAIKARRELFDSMNLGPVAGDPDELKKVAEELTELAFRKQRVIREAEDEVADLQSAQRVKEREEAGQHNDALIALAREHADRRIEILRDAADRDESLRLENERKIGEIERGITEQEIAELRRRIGLAAAGTEARLRLEDELAVKLAAKKRAQAEQRRREDAAERTDLESQIRILLTRRQIQLDVREASDAALITSLRAVGQLRLRAAVDTENQIIEVERRGFERRIKTYEEDLARAKQIFDKRKRDEETAEAQARLAREQTAKATFETEVPFRVGGAEREDIERLRELNEARKRIGRDALSEALEVGRLDIEAMRRRHASRVDIARAERELLLGEINLRRETRRDELKDELDAELARLRGTDLNARRRAELRALAAERNEIGEEEYRQRLQELNDHYDEEAAAKDANYLARKKELEDLFRQRDLVSEEEYQRRKKEIEDKYKRDTDEDPFKTIKDRWTDFKNHVKNVGDSIRESVASVAATVGEAFGSMEDAVRQGIVANILYGESLGQALKKALAAQLANLSAEMFMQGTKHAAYAIGSLAFGNFGAAAKHAAAAAAFFAGAALAGKIGGSLAQSAGMRGGGGAAGSVAAQDAQPRNQTFNYGGQQSTPASEEQAGGSRGRGVMGGALVPLLNRLDQTLSRLEGIPPGQVVSMGASDAHEAIGVAVIRQSGANDSFNDSLARNMRVA